MIWSGFTRSRLVLRTMRILRQRLQHFWRLESDAVAGLPSDVDALATIGEKDAVGDSQWVLHRFADLGFGQQLRARLVDVSVRYSELRHSGDALETDPGTHYRASCGGVAVVVAQRHRNLKGAIVVFVAVQLGRSHFGAIGRRGIVVLFSVLEPLLVNFLAHGLPIVGMGVKCLALVGHKRTSQSRVG